MDEKKKVYETDVLVLGSSASGCGAAIAARRAGAEVLLVDKGKLESSGCLGGGNDHFMAVLDETEHDSLEDMYGYYATPTSGLSRGVVKNYYRAMRPCLEVLEESGIELMRNPDGTYMRSVGFGQPGPWWIHINHGFNVKPRLAKYVRSQGVKVVNHVLVTNLLKDGDRIAGCIGFDVLKGDLIVVRCKTAVLGFGLTAQRVSNNSTHKPFNQWFSPYVTGSQVILPLEAGAGVLNVDITDMATMLPKGWGAPGMNGINNMGGKELNARGERFMGKYDPMLENGLRRNQVMGTYQEELEGNGPPFFMDMTHFEPEDARHLQYDLMPGDKETYLEYCEARKIDFTKTPLEVEISERMIGGIVKCTDEQETEVRNLYTASLCNNFSAAMCMGWTAGEFAAARAAGTDMPALPEAEIAALAKDIFAPLTERPARSIGYTEFEDGIRQVMDYYVGYQRTEGSMKQALKSFAVLEEYLPRLGASTLRELMRVRESMELFKLCRIYIQACMQRRESGRAMYRRADYPDLDPALEKCLVTRLDESGNPVFQWNS
ncbi:MAG TPA: FAD-binding protein [Candidatus Mailhella excrementigallinarum]|nr:FAD-binding protein [Candidatus Mailhella excrementigallinarum]